VGVGVRWEPAPWGGCGITLVTCIGCLQPVLTSLHAVLTPCQETALIDCTFCYCCTTFCHPAVSTDATTRVDQHLVD
jgi:hypothetical protein